MHSRTSVSTTLKRDEAESRKVPFSFMGLLNNLGCTRSEVVVRDGAEDGMKAKPSFLFLLFLYH